MRRISITNLETLCCIARLGTFTAAAERLYTTQSAVSARVRDLEEALRVQLFRRQGRRMELTIQGRELVQRAQPLLGRLEDLIADMEDPAAARGTVRIGVGEIVALTWFGRLMATLRREMPLVQYDIEVDLTVNMHQKLEAGKLDLAFTAAPIDSRRLWSTSLGSARAIWLIASDLHKAAVDRGLSAKAMLDSHAIWCVAGPSPMHPMTLDTLRRHGLAPHRINSCGHIQTLVEVVSSGAGIALLPEDLAARHIERGELVPLSPELPAEQLDFLIAHRRDQEQPVVRRIVEAACLVTTFTLEHVPS